MTPRRKQMELMYRLNKACMKLPFQTINQQIRRMKVHIKGLDIIQRIVDTLTREIHDKKIKELYKDSSE
jgi:hypothetical protein